MIEKNNLLAAVINLLPPNIECYIQAPSLEDEALLALLQETKFTYYKSIIIDNSNKMMFMDRVINHGSVQYFQSLEIRRNGELLFEGYDGVEFGLISNKIDLPSWFVDKYLKDGTCNVSNEW